jgi:hypothetical protein
VGYFGGAELKRDERLAEVWDAQLLVSKTNYAGNFTSES